MMKHKEELAEKSVYTTPSFKTLYFSGDAITTSTPSGVPTSDDPHLGDCWVDSDF